MKSNAIVCGKKIISLYNACIIGCIRMKQNEFKKKIRFAGIYFYIVLDELNIHFAKEIDS